MKMNEVGDAEKATLRATVEDGVARTKKILSILDALAETAAKKVRLPII